MDRNPYESPKLESESKPPRTSFRLSPITEAVMVLAIAVVFTVMILPAILNALGLLR